MLMSDDYDASQMASRMAVSIFRDIDRSRHQFDDGLVLVTDLNPQSVRGLWILMLHLE